MKMKAKDKPTKFAKDADKAFKTAVKRVLLEHNLKGIPIAVWKDGKVQKISPGKISVD